MDEAELRKLLKAHRWSLRSKRIGKRKAYYYYAERRKGLEKQSIYLCPVADLGEKSEEDIVRRLPE